MDKLMDIPSRIALRNLDPARYKELMESDFDHMWSSSQEWAYLQGDIDRKGNLTTEFMESEGMYEVSRWKLTSPGNWILRIRKNQIAKVKELDNGSYEWSIKYRDHKVVGTEKLLNKARYPVRICLDTIDKVDRRF